MTHKIIGTLFISTMVGFISCKKQVIQTDKIETPELTPSYGIPLGYASLNMGDIERVLDNEDFVFNQANQLFELVYQKDVFEFTASDYLQFGTQAFNNSFTAPASIGAALNGGGAGAQASFQEQIVNTINVTNGEMIDSVVINNGNIILTVNSDFSHDVSVNLNSPYITSSTGAAFSTTLNLNYTGTIPVTENVIVDLSGYTVDLTRNGTTSNEIELNALITVTSSGAPVIGTESVSFNSNIELNDYEAVYGYFGQITANVDGATNIADFYANFNNGTLHFEDPRLELFIYNTTGIEVANDFSTIFELADNSNFINSGAGLSNIPNLAPATFVGDTSLTTHLIDNSNTNPTLTDMLDEAPVEVVFSTNSTTNPNGVTTNFITKESKVWARANAILPFFGYLDNFTLSDTTDLDLAEELKLSPEDNLTVEDVEKLTIRIYTDNGLPVTGNIQLYFADSLGNVLDSLFTDAVNGEDIIQGGAINTALPVNDPNYGKVISSTQKTTDIVLVGEKLQNLINQNSKKIIYKVRANTTDSSNQTDIKFFPEYTLYVKVSAKIDFKLNLEK